MVEGCYVESNKCCILFQRGSEILDQSHSVRRQVENNTANDYWLYPSLSDKGSCME